MRNPATDLHEIFSLWSNELEGGNKSAVESRSGLISQTGFDTRLHLQALGYLGEIEAALDELEAVGYPVETWRKYVPQWARMLFNFPYPWEGVALDPEAAYAPSSLDMLQVLGSVIASRQPRLGPEAKDDLQSFVVSVLDLISLDDTITPELKAYLGKLAREMHAALEDEDLPAGFDLEDAVRRLWVGLHAAAGQSSDDESKSRWRDAAGRIMVSGAGSALGSAPTLLMSALGM
jgi:hypothetical protein